MPWLDLNGTRTYYEDYGDGPAVVLLHHGFSSSEMWRGLLPPLTQAGFRAVMYDRRGYGRSDEGEGFKEFFESERFRPAMVADLEELRQALGLEEMLLVGQCEGGVVALDYAVAHPARVKALAAASTMCHSRGRAVPDQSKVQFPDAWHELDPKIQHKMVEWHGEEAAERRWEMFRSKGGAYGTGVFDLRPMLPSVSQPTLILYPDRSALFAVEQALDFYRALPDGELAVMARCGHNTYEQRPQEYAAILLRFLLREANGAEPGVNFMATCAG